MMGNVTTWLRRRANQSGSGMLMLAAGATLVVAIVGCLGLGVGVGIGVAAASFLGDVDRADANLSELPLLHAASATHGSGYALAAGPVDSDNEGVFVLDFDTGLLRCGVLDPRSGRFRAVFETNVADEFGPIKNPNYQIVTGAVDFQRTASPRRPAVSAVYVLETNSGRTVAYGVPWSKGLATGRRQVGKLTPLDKLEAR